MTLCQYFLAQNMRNINEIRPDESQYLQIVRDIAKKPEKLYYRGTLPAGRRPSVAIVGSRKPTAYGREVTERLAIQLASRGIVIVSGLALGVDAIAHKAALNAGGTTIAIQANGLHRIYPSTNAHLGEEIITGGGAIISEYEPDTEPMQHRFLERNRIISGLADIVVITEAAARSGTLNTAGHALAQGRDIYVVPGNITSPMSAGCNQLLKQGAQPLLDPNELLEVLLPSDHPEQTTLPIGATPLEQEIIDALAHGLRSGDDILDKLNADASEFNMALTMLEINGAIKPLGANQWRLS